MSCEILLLTRERNSQVVLPALPLLPHRVELREPDPGALLSARPHDAILVDARGDLAGARELCRLLSSGDCPVIAVLNEGGLVTVTAEWGVDELLLPAAGPAEVDARLRLLIDRRVERSGSATLTVGDLVIEDTTYTARLKGRALELTYKEFELLKFLAQHVGRVFTRAQLLHEVWGHDFFGGTRTVDVHVRRLRAKLGPEYDAMIGTVRNVGYKFVRPSRGRAESPIEVDAAARFTGAGSVDGMSGAAGMDSIDAANELAGVASVDGVDGAEGLVAEIDHETLR